MTTAILLSKVSSRDNAIRLAFRVLHRSPAVNIYSVPDCFKTIFKEQGYIMADFIQAFLFLCSHSIIHCNVLFIKVTIKGKG
jgi:hypothetical protein